MRASVQDSDGGPSRESVLRATGDGSSPPAFTLIAPDSAAGQRADRYLAEAIGTLSRTRVKHLIESGHATRDGTRISEPAEPIRAGALYELAPPPLVAARPLPQDIGLTILYEDRDLLVLDKPAGLVVHPAPGNEDGTLVNALLAHCGDTLPGIGGERRPGIVHRLDQRHVRRDGGRQDRAGAGDPVGRLCRARPGPRLPGAGAGACPTLPRAKSTDRSAATRAIASAWRWPHAGASRR